MLVFCVPSTAKAGELRLKPFKDRLFEYQHVLRRSADGAVTNIQYDELRDVNGRDSVPARRAKSQYVSRLSGKWQREEQLAANGRTINFTSAGTSSAKANLVVIYLHGRGGNRKQGMNDWIFGGNFNRIKNLMARNGGRYVTFDVRDFKGGGEADLFALMRHQKAQSPGAKLYLACGSMGGFVCWRIVKNEQSLRYVDGMLLLGSMWDDTFLKSPALANRNYRFPIYIAHGTKDKTYSWETQMGFFKKIKSASADYPVKITLFDNGIHGTPIRMVDWRSALNWMLRFDKG